METVEIERRNTNRPEFINNVCDRISSNIRERLTVHNEPEITKLVSDALDAEIVRIREEIRCELTGVDPSKGVKMVFNHVITHFNVSMDELLNKSRRREVLEPRQVFSWLIRNKVIPNRLSFREIGLLLGGKDHATILYACRAIDNLNETDVEWREKMMRIINELGKKAVWNGKKLEVI